MYIEPLDQKIIDDIKERLVRAYDPREIHILGPHEVDNQQYNTDIGILIILDKAGLQERFALVMKGLKDLEDIKTRKNILVYTKEEFEDFSQDKETLSYSIKHYGKCIYAKA